MHYTTVVISHVETRYRAFRVSIEVVLFPFCYILQYNINIFISISSTLHVIEPDGVNKLVHNRTNPETTRFERVWIQMQLLFSPSPVADIGPTAGPLVSNDMNVIYLVGSWLEHQTSLRFQ